MRVPRFYLCIGGRLSIKLGRQTTHLVCAASSGQKYDKSLEWGISVVRDTWLLAMGRSGKLEPESEHRHPPSLSASGLSGPKLMGKIGSISNMSAVSDLNEPVDFARIRSSVIIPVTSSTAPPKSLSQQSVSPSRKLKLNPTHIDDQSYVGGSLHGSRSIGSGGLGYPLSTPKPETERLLNQASLQSIDAKVARTSSAPPALSPRKKQKEESPLLKAATMGSGGTGKEGVTEVLRQLAQTDQATPGYRPKVVST